MLRREANFHGSSTEVFTDVGVWVNLYIDGTADATVAGDVSVKLTQETYYPWTGDVTLTIDPEVPVSFSLNLRVPGWCEQFEARVNGRLYRPEANAEGSLSITRKWHADDSVELQFDMPIVRVYAHPLVKENVGRFALRRGPIVYCFEDIDNPGGVFQTLVLSSDVALETTFNEELLGGVTLIRGMATVLNASEWKSNLYLQTRPKMRQLKVTAIPYYAWCNRGASQMSVWVL